MLPEEETVTVVKKRPVHSPEQKKSNSLNRTAQIYYPDESDDDDDDDDEVDAINPRSNTPDSTIGNDASILSCPCCKNCYDRLSKEFDQKMEDLYERCCAKLAHDSNSSNSHAKLTRTASSASQKSTCSSGYGGSIYDPPIYIEPPITEELRQTVEAPDPEVTMKLPASRGSSVSTATSYQSFPSSPTIT